MIQIHTGGAEAAAQGASGAARAPAVRNDAWLQEFERARWDAQPRYRGGDSGAAPAQEPPMAPSASPALKPQAPHLADAEAAPTGAPPALPSQGGAEAVHASAAAFVARSTGTGSPLASPPSLAPAERMREELLRLLGAQRQLRTVTGEPWSARNVHVQADGDAWSVWIRDASLTPRELAPLLKALAQIAERAGERNPSRLTFNGHPLDPSHFTQIAGEAHGN